MRTGAQPVFASLGTQRSRSLASHQQLLQTLWRVCKARSFMLLLFDSRLTLKVRFEANDTIRTISVFEFRLVPFRASLRCISVLFLHLIDTHTCHSSIFRNLIFDFLAAKVRTETRHQFRSHFMTDPVHILLGQPHILAHWHSERHVDNYTSSCR